MDHRLGHNFYRSLQNDAINIIPAAAFNFKRAMRIILCLIKKTNETLLEINVSLKYAFLRGDYFSVAKNNHKLQENIYSIGYPVTVHLTFVPSTVSVEKA